MRTHGQRRSIFCNDPLNAYLYEIGQIPPLGPEEERSCIEHVRADDPSAKPCAKRLVEAHLGLVVSMAERYRNERTNMVDLIQSGNAGLFRAIEALRNFHDDRFSAHARPYIERALAEAVRNSEPSGI